jgi:hypothetical protein
LLATIIVLPREDQSDQKQQGICEVSLIHPHSAMVLVLGCQVLTANQVTFWNALRAAGAPPPITHYGRIFSEPLPAD